MGEGRVKNPGKLPTSFMDGPYTSLPCLPRQRMEKKTQMKKVLAFLIPLVTSFLHKVT